MLYETQFYKNKESAIHLTDEGHKIVANKLAIALHKQRHPRFWERIISKFEALVFRLLPDDDGGFDHTEWNYD